MQGGPKLSVTVKAWANGIGMVLAVASILFVVQRLAGYATQIAPSQVGPQVYAAIAALAVVYGAANLLLARGWLHLLHGFGVDAAWRWTVRVYAQSQLAKYVPGNIFQFVGRQAMGVAAGIGNAPLAKSTIAELLILAAAGAMFVPLVAPVLARWAGFDAAAQVAVWAGPPATLLAMGAALLVIRGQAGVHAARAALSYLSFVALSSAVFTCCFALLAGGVPVANTSLIIGSYVAAWLLGLVTPGAPAGLGIREVVLLALLDGLTDPATILLAVVLGRVVTVSGDLGFFLIGGVILRPNR
jgi:uncharacterized membrane protein YbhN (UPF0104 family)